MTAAPTERMTYLASIRVPRTRGAAVDARVGGDVTTAATSPPLLMGSRNWSGNPRGLTNYRRKQAEAGKEARRMLWYLSTYDRRLRSADQIIVQLSGSSTSRCPRAVAPRCLGPACSGANSRPMGVGWARRP